MAHTPRRQGQGFALGDAVAREPPAAVLERDRRADPCVLRFCRHRDVDRDVAATSAGPPGSGRWWRWTACGWHRSRTRRPPQMGGTRSSWLSQTCERGRGASGGTFMSEGCTTAWRRERQGSHYVRMLTRRGNPASSACLLISAHVAAPLHMSGPLCRGNARDPRGGDLRWALAPFLAHHLLTGRAPWPWRLPEQATTDPVGDWEKYLKQSRKQQQQQQRRQQQGGAPPPYKWMLFGDDDTLWLMPGEWGERAAAGWMQECVSECAPTLLQVQVRSRQ